MKKLLTIAALLILALPLVAQNLQLTVEFPNTVPYGCSTPTREQC